MPAWGDDAPGDAAQLGTNVAALLHQLAADASQRVMPTVTLAHDWHRTIYTGVSSVPGPHLLGAFRGSPHPDLSDHEVVIADLRGQVLAVTPPAAEVVSHLRGVESGLVTSVVRLDALIPAGQRPQTAGELDAVLTLAAVMHGEWIKVHPYANGNGRTARVWANWIALRYGLPPFVRIKPRPDGLLYPQAAATSMASPPSWIGDHTATFSLFVHLLATHP